MGSLTQSCEPLIQGDCRTEDQGSGETEKVNESCSGGGPGEPFGTVYPFPQGTGFNHIMRRKYIYVYARMDGVTCKALWQHFGIDKLILRCSVLLPQQVAEQAVRGEGGQILNS